MSSSSLAYAYLETPIGALLVAGDGERLHHVGFPKGSRAMQPAGHWIEDPRPVHAALDQLSAYFAGELTAFDLPLAPFGSPFERRVWQALEAIPYGTTTTYGAIARTIGAPVSAARAVGAANGANPLPIVVPCHRVIGANGSLTGFGGGLEAKSALLALERRVSGATDNAPRQAAQLNLFAG